MYLLARSVLPSGLGVIMWPQGQLSIDGGIGTSKCNECVQLAAHDLLLKINVSHFLIHIHVLMLCRKFELILIKIGFFMNF